MGSSRGVVAVAICAVCASGIRLRARAAEPDPLDAHEAVVPDTTDGPVQVPPVRAGQLVTGTVFVGYRGSDGETTGAVATFAPWWRSFFRIGAELTPRSPEGEVRFLWGLGLEAARDRTFFAHVHDWGPVRPDRAFTLRNAEASAGYKLPILRGGPLRVAPTAFATLPFDGRPYAGARVALIFGGTWFVSPTFAWRVPGLRTGSADSQEWRFSVALGRWDGQPGGLFVTYRDELTERQFRDRTKVDRHGRGVLALGVNWGY